MEIRNLRRIKDVEANLSVLNDFIFECAHYLNIRVKQEEYLKNLRTRGFRVMKRSAKLYRVMRNEI